MFGFVHPFWRDSWSVPNSLLVLSDFGKFVLFQFERHRCPSSLLLSEPSGQSWQRGMECWPSSVTRYSETFQDGNNRQGESFTKALAALLENMSSSVWVTFKNGEDFYLRYQAGLCTHQNCKFGQLCAMPSSQSNLRHLAKGCPCAWLSGWGCSISRFLFVRFSSIVQCNTLAHGLICANPRF